MDMTDSPRLFPPLSSLEPLATGRTSSLFADDLANNTALLTETLQRSRIAIIGAAGSIGSATLRCILPFKPRSVVLIDLDENNLAELIREIRSSSELYVPNEIVLLPIGLGSIELSNYIVENGEVDYILNFSALKHVRSEKNTYSLVRMLDTNVLFLDELLSGLPYVCRSVFSVSSDKAVNPTSLMGASKKIMEDVLLSRSEQQPCAAARMANVAFSNGSLPFGFLMRLQKRQALAAPSDVRRMFVSHEEAGQLCLLAFALAKNGEVFVPKPGGLVEKTLAEIAEDLVEAFGYEPFVCTSEEEAKSRAAELISRHRWPCYFMTSSTTGEKPHEELYSRDEMVDMKRYERIAVVKPSLDGIDFDAITRFLSFAKQAKRSATVTKSDYAQAIQILVPSLRHVELGRSLDERM